MHCYSVPCSEVIRIIVGVLKLTPSHKVFSPGYVKSSTTATWLDAAFIYNENEYNVVSFVSQSNSPEMGIVSHYADKVWSYHGTIIFDI